MRDARKGPGNGVRASQMSQAAARADNVGGTTRVGHSTRTSGRGPVGSTSTIAPVAIA